MIVGIYVALNALLLLVLSYNVGQNRARTDALQPGDVGDTLLVRAIRAHANAAEYMPLALLMLLLLALEQAPGVFLHGLGAGFTLGRIAQAIGMLREEHPNAIRFSGNLLTGLTYLIAPLFLLYFGWTSLSGVGVN